MPYPDYNGGPTGYYQPDPLVDFPPTGGGGGDRSPWKISIINDPFFPETGAPKWVLSTTGYLMFDPARLQIVTEDGVRIDDQKKGFYVNFDAVTGSEGIDITGESIVYLQYNIENSSVAFEIVPRAAKEQAVWKRYLPEDAFDDLDNIKDLTHSKTPIALIQDNPDPPDDPTPADKYIVKQLARNNMVINDSCFRGELLPVFIPM